LARIPEEYMRLNADDFWGDKKAWKEAEGYISKWPDYKHYGVGLGFYSKSQGTGKTFLATYVARQLIKLGESVYYINFRNIMSLFKAPEEQRLREEAMVRNSTLLILDEVAGSISAAQHDLFAEKFEELVRHRTNYGRITILTTNLLPEDLDKEYPRTYSLLSAKEKHIKVNGKDARKNDGIWDLNQELIENGERKGIC
jgi:DNA replication protein DnaC